MLEDDLSVFRPECADRIHILEFFRRQCGTADNSGKLGNSPDCDGDCHIYSAAAEYTDNCKCEQDARECEQDIHNSHDDRIHPPAEVARDDAQRDTHETGEESGCKADTQCYVHAVEYTYEYVTSEMVGSEPVLG